LQDWTWRLTAHSFAKLRLSRLIFRNFFLRRRGDEKKRKKKRKEKKEKKKKEESVFA